jgi:transposase-like protein
MPTRKQRQSGKEQFWRRMLREWRSSGLSVRAFCRLHGLAEPSFYSWRRVLAKRDGEQPTFVPVRVLGEATTADPIPTSGLELVLDRGRVLRIGPAFDEVTLRRLLALLEESQP